MGSKRANAWWVGPTDMTDRHPGIQKNSMPRWDESSLGSSRVGCVGRWK